MNDDVTGESGDEKKSSRGEAKKGRRGRTRGAWQREGSDIIPPCSSRL